MKAKVQRIKLKMVLPISSEVKLDASITQMAEDGSWFVVEFDGPRPTMRLYPYGPKGAILTTLKDAKSLLAEGITAFEVL